MALKVGELFATLNVDDAGFQKTINTAKSSFASLAAKILSATAVINTAKLGVNYNAQLEQLQTSFEVMTGSAEQAADILDEIREIGAATPFEMQGLAETTQLLMNYGLSADSALDSMMMLGDIAQGDQEKLYGIAMAYGQMSSANKVLLEDVKQMIERGFNPLQEISETTGESMASLYDRISKGTISVDEITASMKRSTSVGGKYFKSMEKQSKTLNGQLSTLQDTAMQLLGDVVSPINDVLTESILPASISAVESIQEAFSEGGFAGVGEMMMTEIADGFESAARYLYNAAASIDLGEIWSGIRKSAGELQEGIRGTLGRVKLKASEFMTSIDWTGIWNGVAGTATTLSSNAAAAISAVSIKASDYLTGIDWEGIWSGITGTYETLKTKAGEILGKIPGIIGGFIEDAANFTGSGKFAELGENIVGLLAAGIESKAGGGAATIINSLTNMFSGITLGDIDDNLRTALSNIGDVVIDAIAAGIGAAATGATALANAIAGVIMTVKWEDIAEPFTGAAAAIITQLSTALSGENAAALVQSLGTAIGAASGAFATVAISIVADLASALVSPNTYIVLWNVGKDLISGVVNGIKEGFSATFNTDFILNKLYELGEQIAIALGLAEEEYEISMANFRITNDTSLDEKAQRILDDFRHLLQQGASEEVALDYMVAFTGTGSSADLITEMQALYDDAFTTEGIKVTIPATPELEATGTPVIPEGFGESTQQVLEDAAGSATIEITADQVAGLTDGAKAELGAAGTEGGKAFGDNVAVGITAAQQSITDAANGIVDSVKTAMSSSYSSMTSAGLNFSRGLASGIRAGRSIVVSAAASIAQAAADAAKSTLKIHSPSKVTEGFGWYFGEGFADGILGTVRLATGAATDLARSAAAAASIRNPGARVQAAYAANSGGGQVAIDYDRLADAMSQRPMVLTQDGREVARIQTRNTAQAQNNYARSIALGYGK